MAGFFPLPVLGLAVDRHQHGPVAANGGPEPFGMMAVADAPRKKGFEKGRHEDGTAS